MALKVLSVVPLPDHVALPFRQHFDVIEGTLDDAARVEPEVLLCSLRPYRLDRAAIEQLPPSVRVIATYSVGHEHIDLAAARASGIAVVNTPAVLGDSVADVGMLLILGAARRATESIALLRSGQWQGWSPTTLNGVELAGKVLGILGMGDIGQRIARRAKAFGMFTAYHNRRPVDGVDARYVETAEALIAQSDVLLLAWPSTADTRRFICKRTLALAKRSLILVNVGRGDLVVDDDLIAALESSQILAAGLDVFDNEPQIDPRYLGLPNAFLLPHIGSSTNEARLTMGTILIAAIRDVMAGKVPVNRIA